MLEIKEKKEYFVNNKTIEIYITKDYQTWFSVNSLATLFNRDTSVIRKHIKNVESSLPLSCRNFACYLPVSTQNRPSLFYGFEVVKLLAERIDKSVIPPLENFLLESLEIIDLVDDEIDTNNQIIIYDNGHITLNVNVSPLEETVWLSAKQIAKLFETSRENISMHISNIFNDAELDFSVSKKFLHTASDGKKYLVEFYNLDMILAVGYRVKSRIAINFRQWASKVLTQIMLKGFVKDDERCLMCKTEILEIKNDILLLKQNQNKEIYYFDGEVLRGFIEIKRFLETATREIIIIDNYFDHNFDDVLAKINVKKIVITNTKNSKISESPYYEIYKCDSFHGRFIIVDDVCYHSGPSIKDIGKHDDLVSKTSEPLFTNFIKKRVQEIIDKEVKKT